MANILLADNHVLSSFGLKYILSTLSDTNIIEVGNLTELHSSIRNQQTDILVLDYLSFRDFDLDILIDLKEANPHLTIMIVTSDDSKERVLKVLEMGVSAFITKECSKEEVLLAIKTLLKGERFFCNRIYDLLLESRSLKTVRELPVKLTTREKEIVKLIVQGKSTQQIADHLFVSYHTINSHRKNILKKLKIKSPTELVIYAIDNGLIEVKA